jgi:hypothetical protein
MGKTDEVKRKKISAWPFLLITIFLTIATHYLLYLYGIVHWEIGVPATSLLYEMDSRIIEDANKEKAGTLTGEESWRIEHTKKSIDRLVKAHSALMRGTGIYPLTGFLSFFFSIFTFTRRPRWVGFIALPFGLYGGLLSLIVM